MHLKSMSRKVFFKDNWEYTAEINFVSSPITSEIKNIEDLVDYYLKINLGITLEDVIMQFKPEDYI